jgi:peptidoglycan/xylan/chitin deacetylase (PgdA/CDA1 family)
MRLLLCFLFALSIAAQPREVAITVDDLPRGGDDASRFDYQSIRAMTEKLLKPLAGTHAIGFVNPGRDSATAIGDDGLQRILRLWREAGLDLGNHTQTHPNINKTALADYQADVLAAEPAITKARGARSVYFRHPFLFTGPDTATRAGLSRFLDEQRYVVAPVTVDNSDWLFAAVYAAAARRDKAEAARVRERYLLYMDEMFAYWEGAARQVTGGDIPQILLIHANQLNADAMPDLLALIRRRGYRFIPLEQALRHPAYRLADGYTGPWGISWIRRWAAAKGIKLTGEPNEPKEILDAFRAGRRGGG